MNTRVTDCSSFLASFRSSSLRVVVQSILLKKIEEYLLQAQFEELHLDLPRHHELAL